MSLLIVQIIIGIAAMWLINIPAPQKKKTARTVR